MGCNIFRLMLSNKVLLVNLIVLDYSCYVGLGVDVFS